MSFTSVFLIVGPLFSNITEDGKDQKLIQSSTTPDPGNIWESVKQYKKTQESQEVSPFPACNHKAARNRHGIIIKINMKQITKRIHKRSTALERSERNEGTNCCIGTGKAIQIVNHFNSYNYEVNTTLDPLCVCMHTLYVYV